MTSVEDGIAAQIRNIAVQIRNIEARYGKPLQEWFGLIAAAGDLDDELAGWLTAAYTAAG